jgi:hypothetical protein
MRKMTMQNRLRYRLDSILSIKRQFANIVDPNKRQKLINQAMKKRNVQLSSLGDLLEFGSRGLARLGRRQKALEKHGRNQGKKPWEKTDPIDKDGRIVREQDPLSPAEARKRRMRKGKEGHRRSKKKNNYMSALRQHIIEFGHSAHFRRALKSLKRKVDSKPYHTMPNGIKVKDVIKENKERMRLKGRLKQAEQSGSKRITKRVLES